MGVFRQFPYSNFHEMNMDEIIKIIKNMLEEWAQYHAEWDAWMDEINDDWSNYQEVMNEAWQNMQDFINNYFDNLDVQNEINNKITSMVANGEFAIIVEPYIPPRVTAWLSEHITQPEGVVIDTSLTVAGACADAKATGDAIRALNAVAIDVVKKYTTIEPYLYKKNTYINASFEETFVDGYNLYKIPLDVADFLTVSWDNTDPFYGTVNFNYVFRLIDNNDDYVGIGYGPTAPDFFFPSTESSYKVSMVVGSTTTKGLVICVKNDKTDTIHIAINGPYPELNQNPIESVETLNINNTIRTKYYINASNVFYDFAIDNEYYALWKNIKEGDIIEINGSIDALSFSGSFRSIDGTRTGIDIDAPYFTAPNDGFVSLFVSTNDSDDRTYILHPYNSIKIDVNNVVGVNDVGLATMPGLGQLGTNLKFIGGVIRNIGSGWGLITTSNHLPLNISSVTVNGTGDIVLTYSFTARNVITLVVTPDETFASQYVTGASVALDTATISIYNLLTGTKVNANSVTSPSGNFWIFGVVDVDA